MRLKGLVGFMIPCFLFVVTGCGSGGDSAGTESAPTDTSIILKGIVQKGVFTQLSVSAYPIDSVTGTLGTAITGTSSSNDSNYELLLPEAGIYELEASGSFVNEVSGEVVTLSEPLLAIVEVTEAEETSNINLLTDLEAQQTLSRIAAGDSPDSALTASTTFVQQSFGLGETVDFSQLDQTAITADALLTDPNLQLLLLSAAVLLDASVDATGVLVFDPAIADFGSLISVEDVVAGLSLLNGSSALNLYQSVQGNLTALPENIVALLTEEPVFICQLSNCEWQVFSQRSVSLMGSDVLESEAKVGLAVQLSSISDTDIQVMFTSRVATADEGIDYIPDAYVITVPAGTDRYEFEADLLLDDDSESSEGIRYEITAIGDSYTIANASKLINVIDGFGSAAESLDGQVEISSLCLSAVGDGLDIESQGCLNSALTAIPQKSTAAVSVDLSLKIICDLSNLTDCVPFKRDWLVKLSLQALDIDKNLQASETLGYYWFPGSSLHEPTAQQKIETAYAHINAAMLQMFDDANSKNWSLRINAKLEEITPLGNQGIVDSINQPIFFPQQIAAGDYLLDYTLESFEQTASCNGNNYSITAGFSLDGENYNTETVCVEITPGATAAETTGSLAVGSQMPLAGFKVPLPDFHSSHIVYGDVLGNRLQSLGADYLIVPSASDNGMAAALQLCTDIDCFYGQGLTSGAQIEGLSTYLHAEGLPFAFKITSGYLDDSGIHLAYSARKYLHAGEFAQFDFRHPDRGGRIKSNDIFYKESGAGTLQLTATGISEQINVSAGSGSYAFPEASLTWQAFSFNIDNSQISGLTTVPTSFTLRQTPRCKGCATANLVIHSFQGDLSLDSKGTALGQLTALSPSVPTWGQVSGQQAFQRPGDIAAGSTAMVSLPGYIFELPEAVGMDSLLLSHVENNGNELIRHSISSDTAIEGNEWPVGITLGPQMYFSATGVPVAGTGRLLNNTDLVIDNGIDNAFNKAVNIGAKYVIRNSGITGVFNLDIDPNTGDDMVIYGYDMRFSRFAFRLTDNAIDDYSWIDGRVHLPGNASFDTEFVSLTLTCDAKFGEGLVAYCDNPACQQNLNAWKADTEISKMAFIGAANGDEAQACVAESQQLTLNQTVEMFALSDSDDRGALKPVGLLNARWSPAGEILSSNLAPLQDMILDEKISKQGFSIAPREGGLQLLSEPNNANYGVLELKNTELVASQFWDSMQTDIRLANTSTEAESSVVVAAGELTNIDNQRAAQNNDQLATNLVSEPGYRSYSPDADFTWNHSAFGFSLPVYYSTGLAAEQASFYGRYKKTDLLIMQAGAGIDFIQPVDTHLSFGASANLPELGSLPLRIDLTDLSSLQNVDDLLATININLNLEQEFSADIPLQPLLKDILHLGNSGILFAIEETLDEILSQSAQVQIDGVNVDLWQEVAEPIVALQSIPLQIDAVLDAGVSQTFDTGVYQKSLVLKAEFEILNNLLIAFKDEPVTNAAVARPIALSIERIKTVLQEMKEANNQVLAEVNTVYDQMLTLINTTDGRIAQQIARLDVAINRISGAGSGILEQAFDIQGVCNETDLTVENARFLKPGIRQVKNVENAIGVLGDITNIIDLVSFLYTGEAELNQQFQQSIEGLEIEANLLRADFNDAKSSVYGAICGNATASYLQQAQDHFNNLQQQVNAISIALQQSQQAIAQSALETAQSTTILSVYLDSVNSILSDAQQQLINPSEVYNIEAIAQQINDAITNISFGTNNSYQIEVLFAAEGSGQLDFHAGVILPIQLKLEAMPARIRELIPTVNISGAYFSADEYKAMIIDSIMNSEGIAFLRTDINQFLQSYIDEIMSAQLVIGDQINLGIKTQLAKIASPLNDLIAEATAELPLPITAGKLDGEALIASDQLSRIHIEAEFETPGQDKDVKGNKFMGAFDAYRETSDDGSENCGSAGEETFTAGISAQGPISIGASNPPSATINLNFIFQPDNSGVAAFLPVGLNGGITVEGAMKYDPFVLHDFGFVAGLGLEEVYLGAGGAGTFHTTDLGLYAFVGRTCNAEVITNVDNEIADLVTMSSPFTGLYGRGAATIPVYDNGCALNVSARATIGNWITIEPVPEIGGLIGGGVMGQLACIGSVRGQMIAAASYNTRGDLFFAGKAFAVAGVGPDCDAGTWTSRERSRGDDWCGTADIEVGVKYEDDTWEYVPQPPSALH